MKVSRTSGDFDLTSAFSSTLLTLQLADKRKLKLMMKSSCKSPFPPQAQAR
jgi:hypothetical protein